MSWRAAWTRGDAECGNDRHRLQINANFPTASNKVSPHDLLSLQVQEPDCECSTYGSAEDVDVRLGYVEFGRVEEPGSSISRRCRAKSSECKPPRLVFILLLVLLCLFSTAQGLAQPPAARVSTHTREKAPRKLGATLSGTSLGKCAVEGECFSSLDYDNGERCTFTITQTGPLIVVSFETEVDYDKLFVGGTAYSGTSGPDGVQVSAGDQITWESDSATADSGFEICVAYPCVASSGVADDGSDGNFYCINGGSVSGLNGAYFSSLDHGDNEQCTFAMGEGGCWMSSHSTSSRRAVAPLSSRRPLETLRRRRTPLDLLRTK